MTTDRRGQQDPGAPAPEKIEVLPLEPGNVERICELAAEIWWQHYPDIIGPGQIEYMLKQRYAPAVVRAELRRRDLWWDKLLANGRIIGFASYFLSDRRGEMKLDKLYVHPGFQRRGYGGMLIRRASSRAREEGCSGLILAVNKHNRHAIAAYLKHGFRVREAAVKEIGGGYIMDDYIMELDVADV